MAKFIDEWEPPRLEEKEHSTWWIWLIVLILIVGLVFVFLKQPAQTTKQTVTETGAPSTETTTAQTTSSKETTAQQKIPTAIATASNAPEMDSHCIVVAGIVPGTIVKSGNSVSFSFKNNGKTAIEGSYFEFGLENSKTYKQNSDSIAPGETISYAVDLSESAGTGSSVKSLVVLPIQDGKACYNQKMIVIK